MPVPFIFEPDTPILSSEANANFAYLDGSSGEGGTNVGPRGRLSAVTTTKILLGWNAQEVLAEGNARKLARIENDLSATAIEVGDEGFVVRTTSEKAGDANAQLHPVLAVRATATAADDDYVYIKEDWHIQRTDAKATKLDDYRLTYVPLSAPVVVFEYIAQSGSKAVVYNAYSLGIPKAAKAINMTMRLFGNTGGATFVQVGQARATRNRRFGFFVDVQRNQYASGGGVVPLGEGAYLGQFVVDRSASLGGSSLYITGYYI